MSDPHPEAGDRPLPEKTLKELFAQSRDRGRAGLPVMSLSMGRGLVPRNQDERRVETNLGDEEHRLVRAGELAYNMMRMWQGVCSLAEEDCLVSPAYVVVRPLDGMDARFSEYLLTYEETVAQFKRLSFGVVDDRLRLYYKDFERVRVKVPSPEAQKKIAKILTSLDNLIEKTESLIAKYQAVKQGMMQDLFTRGLDEHGHLRPPYAEAPHLYKPSPLGTIPKDWSTASVSEFGDVVTGTTPPPSRHEYYDGPFMFVTPADIQDDMPEILATSQTISSDGMSVSRAIPACSICTVCIGATIGKLAVTTSTCATNQQINTLIPDRPNYSKTVSYLMRWFLPSQLRKEAGLQAVPIVNKSTFSKLLISCPDSHDEWLSSRT